MNSRTTLLLCEERGTEALEGLLYALMAHDMGLLNDHQPQG
jgi:hypothetical protein